MINDQPVDQEDNKECYVAERDSNDNDVENRNLKPTKELTQLGRDSQTKPRPFSSRK